MTTYDRSTLGSDPKVRCDACSPFDENGFSINLPGDEGSRVWSPRWSMSVYPCPECGLDANRQIPWDSISLQYQPPTTRTTTPND